MSALRVVTHADRPDVVHNDFPWFAASWPQFMFHDPVCGENWHHLEADFPRHQVYLFDGDTPVGVGNSIPFPWDGDPATLPDGIDGVFPAAARAVRDGTAPTAVSAIQAVVDPARRGAGLSAVILRAFADAARAAGLRHLVAPVRPTLKHRYPLVPMEEYVRWTRPDGLPFDPWMRVHARLGARVVGVCHRSMTIRGTVAQWEEWGGLPLPAGGRHVVPFALVPVTVDHDADIVEYVEPNVWMQHPL